MHEGAESSGLLTIGNNDNRITGAGRFLRKHKLDELPQLINVLNGSMSIVGPRPEVRKYVDLYSEAQLKVLSVSPGLTDFASIEYINESEILARSDNPEETYISEIMPAKLKLNLKYIEEMNLLTDIKIIFRTFRRMI
jgi:lipopolysaccharide/colanic/teichoic acid biosynthesis glycosyltransferase